MSRFYILNGKMPQKVPSDALVWAKWMQENDSQVKCDVIEKIAISTVFLGLDHNYLKGDDTFPLLFETMIFGGKHDEIQDRYTTWEEAETGHEKAVRLVKSSLPNPPRVEGEFHQFKSLARTGGFGTRRDNKE